MAEVTETTSRKRREIAKKVYINSDGEESSHASPDAVRMEFRFNDGGSPLVIDPDQVGPGCRKSAMFHGIFQKVGDSYAGAENAQDARERAETLVELLYNDEWLKPRESAGPRPTLLLDAIVAALENEGQTVGDDRRNAIREKIKDKEGRAKALANPKINAEYERIRAEKAMAKADEAAKAADETDVGVDF